MTFRNLSNYLRLAVSISLVLNLNSCLTYDDDDSIVDESDSETDNTPQFTAVSCNGYPVGQVNLPTDESPHDEPWEWWYWTGHLQTADGRWFGYETTFFIINTLGTKYLAVHHAISDIENEVFVHRQDVALWDGNVPEAGFQFTLAGQSATGADGIESIQGQVDNFTLDINLNALKKPVLQHGTGYHERSWGGFTYYYSRERIETTGTITIDGEPLSVTGTSWFDHQWGASPSATEPDPATGWHWMALQLDDGREAMITTVQDVDGNSLLMAGTLTDSECHSQPLDETNIVMTPLREWTSPETGCTYPLEWDITVGDLNLHITPAMDNQELTSAQKTYWEGAALISGDATGRAYVELVGYCSPES